MFIPLLYFYKIDVTLERQLRKLHVCSGTAEVFTRITNYFRSNGIWLHQESHSYSHTVIVIPIISIPYLPRIRNKEIIHFLFLIPYFLFVQIDSIPYFTRIGKKKLNNVFVPYSSFYKIDVTLRRPLRKLHVFVGPRQYLLV